MGFFDDLSKKYKEPVYSAANSPFVTVKSFPTKIATLDRVLNGGIPKGRFTQIYGDFGTLKTMVSLLACASAMEQEPDRPVLYFDFEYSITPEYLSAAGIELGNSMFHIAQPSSPEIAIKMAAEAIQDGNPSIIVFDSVVAMQPKSIHEGSVEAAGIGVHAKMLNKMCVQLTPLAAKYDTALIFINQVRVNLSGYGDPESRPGGRALDFYSDLMLRFGKSRIDKPGSDKEIIGAEINVQVKKSRVSKPFQKCTFNMFYETGVDFIGATIAVAVDEGIVSKSGAWYTYGDVKVQGAAALTEYFASNPVEYAVLEEKVRNVGS